MADPRNPPAGAFVYSRTFDAPRELIFRAFTEPDRLERWWGSPGCKTTVVRFELRPGGVFHYRMETPDGHEMWGRFVFREIAPPERLVFVVSFTDAEAAPVRHPMSPTWPLEVLSTTTFTEGGGRTTLHIEGVPINATEEERRTFEEGFEGMQQGYGGTMDQLAAYLANA